MLLGVATRCAFREVFRVPDQDKDKPDLEITQPQVSANADPLMKKVQAFLYLLAGLVVILCPVWLIFNAMNGKEIPIFNQIMYFCAVCIAGILGLAPWLIRMIEKR